MQFYNTDTICIVLNNTYLNIFLFTGILEVPENISVICSTENVAFLSWTTKQLIDSTNAPAFVVSYRRLDSHQVLNSSTIIGTSAMLKNLVKNAVYSFTVIAISSKGEKASTSQTCTVPGMMKNDK